MCVFSSFFFFFFRFELLQVYSGIATNYSALYSPESSNPNLLDYTLSYHLHDLLLYSSLTQTYTLSDKLQYNYVNTIRINRIMAMGDICDNAWRT